MVEGKENDCQKETTARIKKSPLLFSIYRLSTVRKFEIFRLKVVEGKENDCEKRNYSKYKKNPPAVFNFIDEQLWQSLPSVDWKWLKEKNIRLNQFLIDLFHKTLLNTKMKHLSNTKHKNNYIIYIRESLSNAWIIH